MSATLVLVHLAGQVALLLWGLHMVHSGVVRAYGSSLRRMLSAGLSNRFSAFLAGLGVTGLLQSSTATALMATSFTAGGLVGLVPALAIMLGANVGTTLIVQILSFDLTSLAPALILIGLVAFKRRGSTRTRDLGRVGIGLGLMLLSLELLVTTIGPVKASPVLQELVAAVAGEPLLGLLIAAVLTWAAHASVAVVLLIMSLAGAGIVPPEAALAMVLGANLGGAIPPVVAALGPNPASRRLPVGNLAFRFLGCAAVLPFLDPIASALAALDADPARQAVNFHTGFNLAVAAAGIGLLNPAARLLVRLLPEQVKVADPATPQYLDPEARRAPYVALTNAAREAMRMADVVEAMLRGSLEVFQTDDRKRVAEICRMDNILDRLNDAIKLYLADIGPDALDEEDNRRCSEILAFTINLEHVGDVIDKGLMDLAGKKIKHQLSFSDEGLDEIRDMHLRLLDNLQLALAVFMANDARSARRLVVEKEIFRDLEHAATESHFARLRDGRLESIETSALHLDILRDLKRINSLIAAAAYPILDQTGQLRRSRLKESARPLNRGSGTPIDDL